jgi:hypothetical protein
MFKQLVLMWRVGIFMIVVLVARIQSFPCSTVPRARPWWRLPVAALSEVAESLSASTETVSRGSLSTAASQVGMQGHSRQWLRANTQFYNSMTKQRETFEPVANDDTVSFYRLCTPSAPASSLFSFN